MRGRYGTGGTASLRRLERGSYGEQRVYLGVGQEVAALRIGGLVGVELRVVGEVGEVGAAADVEARGGGDAGALDACLTGELDQALGFTVMFGSGHWRSSWLVGWYCSDIAYAHPVNWRGAGTRDPGQQMTGLRQGSRRRNRGAYSIRVPRTPDSGVCQLEW